ncbi:hypothetical protein LJR078_002916 [Arthrobacter sp. LjRoot78]|uniref:hypothetical protein n=1 Tax=Arthrobacter sp. LjRoot78 TaxID=3342338 RepID=UPI003ECFC3F8
MVLTSNSFGHGQLAFEPGPGTRFTRRALGLADLPDDHDLVRAGVGTDHDLVRAGVGTLNVRDTASVDGEKISLHGPARHLARVFSSATLWFDITRVGPDAVAPAYIADSPVGRVALFLRPLSEYVCLPMNDGAAEPAIANIKVLENGVLQLAAPPLDDSGQLTVRDLAAGEQPGAAVRALLSVPA